METGIDQRHGAGVLELWVAQGCPCQVYGQEFVVQDLFTPGLDHGQAQLAAGLRWTSGKRWLLDAQLRWLDVSGVTMEAEDGVGTVEADYSPLTLLVAAGWRW